MSQVSRRTVMSAGAAAALLGGWSPQALAAKGETGWVRSTMARMSLEQKVGQLFVQHVYGSSATAPDERNVEMYGTAVPADIVRKFHLGGICYFAWTDSVKNPQQIQALSNGLQEAAMTSGVKAPVPLLLSADQEQGVVTRIGPPATQFPGSMALGAGRSVDDATTAARITGRELRAMGVNLDYAPVADVNVNAANPVIGTRSFGSRPELVSSMVAAQVRGYQGRNGVSACAKHFPGHGDTATDSHVAFPIITHSKDEWSRIDAPPFRAAIAAGIDMIMTAHLSMPALDPSGLPATLSKPVVTGLLRDELGFDGVIVTDSLRMEGVRELFPDPEVAVRALMAGVDQVLMTPTPAASIAAVMDAVRTGRISRAELDAKVRRVLTLKYRRGIVASPYAAPSALTATVGTPAHLAAAAVVTDRTTTVVKNDDAVLPVSVASKKVFVVGWGTTPEALGKELANRGASTTVKATGASPTDAVVSQTVAATEGHDLVVVTTMKAWDTKVTDRSAGQQKLVKALLDSGIPVIVAAVRDPYDIAWFPDAPTYLATYSFNDVSMAALARVIVGEVEPTGKLPVDIPTAADPEQVLYPFGHGLTYA